MKIFEEAGKIRLQLMETIPKPRMLFDFAVDKKLFKELKDHIIENLQAFEVE